MYFVESVNFYNGPNFDELIYFVCGVSQLEKYDLSPEVVFGRTIQLFNMSKSGC